MPHLGATCLEASGTRDVNRKCIADNEEITTIKKILDWKAAEGTSTEELQFTGGATARDHGGAVVLRRSTRATTYRAQPVVGILQCWIIVRLLLDNRTIFPAIIVPTCPIFVR
jgi:hypothetical protein